MDALGERIQEPQYREQALAVARETVDRIHKNLTVLVERLKEEGYKFGIAVFKAEVLGKPKKAGLEGTLEAPIGNPGPYSHRRLV
jgi:hypothetical protein